MTRRFGVLLDSEKHTDEQIKEFKQIIDSCEGNLPIKLMVNDSGVQRIFHLNQKVKLNDEFIQKVENLFGEDSIRYLTT